MLKNVVIALLVGLLIGQNVKSEAEIYRFSLNTIEYSLEKVLEQLNNINYSLIMISNKLDSK